MNKILLKCIRWGVIIIILDIAFVAFAFNYYTNKADEAVRDAYVGLAENLQAKTITDGKANCTKIIISVNEDSLNTQKSKGVSDQFEKFLVAHYDAQTFWLNTWITLIGIILAVITFVAPMLAVKWHEGKMKEVDRDLEKFKTERDGLLQDLKIAKEETDKSKLEAEKSSFRANLYRQFNLVDSFINTFRYKEALDLLKEISKNELTDIDIALVLAGHGNIAWKLGNKEDAINFYNEAVKTDPTNAPLFNDLGYYQFIIGDIDSAIKNYKIAISLTPSQILFYKNLATAYYKKSDAENYKFCLEKIISINPSDALAYNNFGVYWLSEGKWDLAFENFEKAIFCDSQNAALAYLNSGIIYNFNHKYYEAIKYIEKGISIRPEIALSYLNLAATYLSIGKYPEARELLKIFLNKKEAPDIFYSKGSPLWERIRAMLKDIISKIPSNENDIIDLLKKSMKKFEDKVQQ